MDSLEPFYPERMSSRILGMGDVLTLYEKVRGSCRLWSRNRRGDFRAIGQGGKAQPGCMSTCRMGSVTFLLSAEVQGLELSGRYRGCCRGGAQGLEQVL